MSAAASSANRNSAERRRRAPLQVPANGSVRGIRLRAGLIRIASQNAEESAPDRARGMPLDRRFGVQIPASVPAFAPLRVSFGPAGKSASVRLLPSSRELPDRRRRTILPPEPNDKLTTRPARQDYNGGSSAIFEATTRQAEMRSSTNRSSASAAPSYSVRFRKSWPFESTRQTSGPRPSVSGRTWKTM